MSTVSKVIVLTGRQTDTQTLQKYDLTLACWMYKYIEQFLISDINIDMNLVHCVLKCLLCNMSILQIQSVEVRVSFHLHK